MSLIKNIKALEVLDSRGFPTLEVSLELDSGHTGKALVPSGASTGSHEAFELRDGGSRYKGKGVLQAVDRVESHIRPSVLEKKFPSQKDWDEHLIKLDGKENKSHLGANAILGASLAFLRASARKKGSSLFSFWDSSKNTLPTPLLNVLNGGAHANNDLDIQEFMIVPVSGGSFKEALRVGTEVFHALKSIVNEKGMSTAVGDEGGLAPQLKKNEEALDLLIFAIEKAGYKPGEDVFLALDVASQELFEKELYLWEGKKIPSDKLSEIYQSWLKKYPLISIEDGLSEDDWSGWKRLTRDLGEKVQLVGDDLFVTHKKRLQKGVDEKVANSILIKLNQVGTVTETMDTIQLAKNKGYKTILSHRSGETEDAYISDLSVAFSCEQIKTGAPCRGERTAKYNQLLRIEDELGDKAQFLGLKSFKKS